MSTQFQNNSIFWVEVEKINPNPYQPRREFDQNRLRDLAESIRQYGVLQPLTVTRKERVKEDGGLVVEYELIAGERRHRASKLAGLKQVPVIIRSGEENSQVKLELAIIENLQREDISPIERAKAFAQLAEEFNLKHTQIAKKVGKSREYVSNTIRLLNLPDDMQQAIMDGKMTEGHARPILMLTDRPEEQSTLFKEVVYKKLTVREAEKIARKIAQDRVRKKAPDPELVALEKKLSESLGTRVQIEQREVGGKIVIDFFSPDDVKAIINIFESSENVRPDTMSSLLNKFIKRKEEKVSEEPADVKEINAQNTQASAPVELEVNTSVSQNPVSPDQSVSPVHHSHEARPEVDNTRDFSQTTNNDSREMPSEHKENVPQSASQPISQPQLTSQPTSSEVQENNATHETSSFSHLEHTPKNNDNHLSQKKETEPVSYSIHDDRKDSLNTPVQEDLDRAEVLKDARENKKDEEEDLYSIANFTI